MLYMVLYDITTAKGIKKVSRICIGNGMIRLQKSIFLGELVQSQIIEMRDEILKWLQSKKDRVAFLPLHTSTLQNAVFLGETCDYENFIKKPYVVFL